MERCDFVVGAIEAALQMPEPRRTDVIDEAARAADGEVGMLRILTLNCRRSRSKRSA